jgi:hypothetical protein
MTKRREPQWKRKGYQAEDEYRAACSATKKTQRAAMASTTARNGTSRVLQVMWSNAEFDAPRVTITKEQIMAKAPCSLSSVKRALKELRSEGSIKPVKNWQGGSGVATTWRLLVPGASSTPADDQIEAMEAKRNRAAAWSFLKAKYGPMKALELMGDQED